jgi:hypothetical protein
LGRLLKATRRNKTQTPKQKKKGGGASSSTSQPPPAAEKAPQLRVGRNGFLIPNLELQPFVFENDSNNKYGAAGAGDKRKASRSLASADADDNDVGDDNDASLHPGALPPRPAFFLDETQAAQLLRSRLEERAAAGAPRRQLQSYQQNNSAY